ncbi:AAA family ATPase [Variovorax sp. dw_308]|uniref:AAA family ATPase n=1 Tax=Variovorax sp. dw_308 TaxID=2721546 RepID=UPI001C478991|nr:AAA family ATPase [Variovorax sp. dw_308]
MKSATRDQDVPPGYAQYVPDWMRSQYSPTPLLVPVAVQESLLQAQEQRRAELEEIRKAEATRLEEQRASKSRAESPKAVTDVFERADERDALIRAFERYVATSDRTRFFMVLSGNELLRITELVLSCRDDADKKNDLELLRKLFDKGPLRAIANPAFDPARWQRSLARLYDTHPHFREVTDCVAHRVCLSIATGEPLWIPPLHLTGLPGVGKTRYANDLAEALEAPIRRHSMENAQAAAALLGTERHWSTAAFGMVFEQVLLGTHANPVFLIDELDKAAAGGNCNPTGPLHSLLEPETSANVVDAMLGITFNARLVIYIATSNDRNKVPESILSRFREFEISPPMGEEALQLARVVVRSAVADAGVVDFAPPEDAWAHKLAFYTPREIGQHVHLAIARAVANNRRHLTAADLPTDPDDPVRKNRYLH